MPFCFVFTSETSKLYPLAVPEPATDVDEGKCPFLAQPGVTTTRASSAVEKDSVSHQELGQLPSVWDKEADVGESGENAAINMFVCCSFLLL